MTHQRLRLLAWAARHTYAAYLDSNGYLEDHYRRYELLVGVADEAVQGNDDGFEQLRRLQGDWVMGYLSYDQKNHIEVLHSNNTDTLGLPDYTWWVPHTVIGLASGQLHVLKGDKAVLDDILAHPIPKTYEPPRGINLQQRIARPDYLATVEAIREHIAAGDVYEMNFCQEFYAEGVSLDPVAAFVDMNRRSEAPFAAFVKAGDSYLMCSSPERYLQKQGRQLVSQPIKGTIARSTQELRDLELRRELAHSEKDRAENVMIVDLVRNDLARTCKPGSVQVTELFGTYGFKRVWQMISTITGELRDDCDGIDALRASYPMGSMTGAPKVMAMQLIEHYEQSKRGLYSGTVGYMTPEGDYDFNVVIRSLLYRADTLRLSFQVGGAIVYDSDPEREYEECLLKAQGMLQTLGTAI